ncbi:MAG: hypothetical protein CVU00_11605 [Bacteroidetes bacterium HGW-Bacteroidetes-17]|nr:MAG: hypothetical protein CVU00_11605 [Bacteroidetes bacterium HGW-Bacteroidetes-17]
MRNLRIIICAFMVMNINTISAQNKLSISKKAPIFLDLAIINNAGSRGKIIVDDSQWLNYTILIGASDPTASISVNISSGSVPEGLELYIEAKSYRGFSNGKIGKPVGKVQLSHIPKTIIDNIGTSYTGSGRNEGHQLIFSFKITDYAKIQPGISTIFVDYTITQ